MAAAATTKAILPLHHHHHHAAATKNGLFISIHAYQNSPFETQPSQKPSNKAIKLAESLSNMLHLHIERNLNYHPSNVPRIEDKHDTPTMSPKEDISKKWQEIRGSNDWNNLLDPLHPWLRREIVKYGEFAQATYDAFDFDSFSEYCGSCRYNERKLFGKLGLIESGYKVAKYVYAMSHIDLPEWLERSRFADTWSKDSNWMGFVAVSDDQETRRIGRRDIVVAWRGTVAPSEWYDNMQRKLEPIGQGEAKVEHGFLSLYTSKSESTRYNKSSASEQVMREVKKLVNYYKGRGEEVGITITGHSLGGALALLNAYEAAKNFPSLPISVISFAAPRVGNIAFRDELYQMGVKTLRVTIKQDIVPRMPGIVFNESLQKFDDITGTLEWIYTHVGVELKLDIRSSPYLKKGLNLVGIHMLETYLHLVDGFLDSTTTFRSDARRDVVLVNKDCNMLVDELRIPHNWYQLENKGLERNFHRRWVKPTRYPEDIPSPTVESYSNVLEMHDSYGLESLFSI
ncbi:phospholipase A1-Igamma1, chloroplastic [Olea europaea subsp. europaea]|uniref:Phospholipase A1-Igamma1, chloroplastic n=1 Tax=Olea europaea subsp. europaea TaxID=158383 RepID=A0A8S0RCV4_OLEEU|nr:phospholipase A1-Igamma1, chloroplastic [Olea europaea subsp. europaea]